jgi:hypothetical protein
LTMRRAAAESSAPRSSEARPKLSRGIGARRPTGSPGELAGASNPCCWAWPLKVPGLRGLFPPLARRRRPVRFCAGAGRGPFFANLRVSLRKAADLKVPARGNSKPGRLCDRRRPQIKITQAGKFEIRPRFELLPKVFGHSETTLSVEDPGRDPRLQITQAGKSLGRGAIPSDELHRPNAIGSRAVAGS